MARNTKNTIVKPAAAPVVETPAAAVKPKPPIQLQHGYVEQLVDATLADHVAAGGRVDVGSVATSTTESPAAIVKLVADTLAARAAAAGQPSMALSLARVNRDMRWLLCSRTSTTIGSDANGKPVFIPRGHRSPAAAVAREHYAAGATAAKPVAKRNRNRKS